MWYSTDVDLYHQQYPISPIDELIDRLIDNVNDLIDFPLTNLEKQQQQQQKLVSNNHCSK